MTFRNHLGIKRLLSAMALATVAVCAGCGGSSGTAQSGSSGTAQSSEKQQARATRYTKAQFIARADTICKRVNTNLEPLFKEYDKAVAKANSVGTSHVVDILGREDRMNRAADRALDAIPLPTDKRDAQGAQGYVDAITKQDSLERLLTAATRDQDEARMSKLNAEIGRVSDRRVAVAHGYGFKVCGRP